DAQKYGARVALFGRKINNAEHQLAFIEMLRLITDGRIGPEKAVRAYHAVLQARKISPHRALEDDLKLTDPSMSYAGASNNRATGVVQNTPWAKPGAAMDTGTRPGSVPNSPALSAWPKHADGSPDFAPMSSSQRLPYDQWRLPRGYGGRRA